MTDTAFAPTSQFAAPESAFDVETFDSNFRQIQAVESRWRLPALPDEVKLDLAGMPGVTPDSVGHLLNGIDRDIHGGDEEISLSDPVPNYRIPLLDPNFGQSGFDQIRKISAGIAQRPAPTDPTADAVKRFKEKAIKGGYLQVPDGTELDSIWSPELNSVRFEMAQDDYDKSLRGNRHGAVPVTGENGLIKQLDKWTSPGGLLAAATELDLFWDGGAITKEFSTWGDKWRKVGKSENPWDFATNLVDAVTGPIDDVVFPVLNWALIGTGVGAIGNSARIGWMASKASNGSKLWKTLYGGTKIMRPSTLAELGQPSWTATKLGQSGSKVAQGLGRGMEAWRSYKPVKVVKSALQVPMRAGFISQVEGAFPGYGGEGWSLGDIGPVKKFAEMAESTAQDPRFLPAELAFTPYNIFSAGTFVRQGTQGAGLLTAAGDLARRAGTPVGRSVVGAGAGAVAGAMTGDDAGDIAESAGLGAIAGLVLPSVGRALASPSGRVIGSSALGALAGTGIAAVSDEDLSDGLMVGAVSGLGLVGASSVWSKVPNPGRWVGHIGTAMSRLNLRPLTDDQRVTASVHRAAQNSLAPDELSAYDQKLRETGSVIDAIAHVDGTDAEGARHSIGFKLVTAGIDNTARLQAGPEGSKGFFERFYMHRNKLVAQLRTFDLEDLSSQTLDDIARAMVMDKATTYSNFKKLWRVQRTELAKDPQKALTFARSHNENAHATLTQLMSIDNLGIEQSDDMFEESVDLVPSWNKQAPEEKLGALETYLSQTRNTPFGHWGEFYESTEGLQRGMVAGWFDNARFLPGTNRWGQQMGPGIELGEVTKQAQAYDDAISDTLLRMPTKDVPKALKGNRFSPLARLAPMGRFTVMRKENWTKQQILTLADEVGHYLDTQALVRQLGSTQDSTTTLGQISRAAQKQGLGALDDLDNSAWKELIRVTGNKSKRHKIDQLRKFAKHRGMSMRDVETKLEGALDELAHDARFTEAGLDEYVKGAENEGILRGARALEQRKKQLNQKARYTAAEIDVDDLKASIRQSSPDTAQEVEEILDGLADRGYKLVHGVEFLSPHDLANSNSWGFADMGTREVNYMTAGNFFRGKLPAVRRADEERRRRTALAHTLSELGDTELGDVTPDSIAVTNALEDLTKTVLRPLQDNHMRQMEDLHTMNFWEKKRVGVSSFGVPQRIEDLTQKRAPIMQALTANGWTEAQADAIYRSIPMMQHTEFKDLGAYSFEARARQRNELVQALKFASGSNQGHLWQGLGAGVGAVAGANQDPDATGLERFGQAVVGGAIGAAVGTGVRSGVRGATSKVNWTDLERRAASKQWGYMGDKYVRLRDNLRFGLSPFFDISRYTEGLMLAQTAAPLRKADGSRLTLPLNMTPRGFRNRLSKGIKEADPSLSPFEVRARSRAEFNALRDEFNAAARGDYDPEILDNAQKWFTSIGIMGFNPTDWMSTAYGNLRKADPSLTPEKAYQASRDMYTYGTSGRSAAELTTNFIFFPFSFQKKAMTHIGKWMHDDLARSLMIHDAFKTYEILDEKYNLDKKWKEHLPLLDRLNKLNLLAFGVSPGRFGGINAQVFSSAYKASMALFMPGGLSIKNAADAAEVQDIFRQLAPALTDIDWMIKDAKEQGHVAFSPTHQTTRAEISSAYDEWGAYRNELDQHMRELDMTWSDLYNQPWAADMRTKYEAKKFEIAEKYPSWLPARREHIANIQLLEMERNDRIGYVMQDPSVQGVLQIRNTEDLAPLLNGLPQRATDDLMLAWFDTQVDWVKDQLTAQGVSVGGQDGWLDAPPEAADYLLSRSVELRNMNPAWYGLWQKFYLKELGVIEAPI